MGVGEMTPCPLKGDLDRRFFKLLIVALTRRDKISVARESKDPLGGSIKEE